MMKIQYFFLILSLIFVCVSATTDSTPPVWPNTFEQTFVETFSYPVLGSSTTTGKFFYDFPNRRYRIDRVNGKWDRYCGPVYPFSNTACSQIVVDGKRYLYYPEKNYCCYCCGSEYGCGILKPDWLSNASYLGVVVENGVEYQKHNVAGLQNNYYFSTNDNRRIMMRIIQEPNDIQEFNVDSFSESIHDASVFTLPNGCDPKKTCPLISTCTAVRKGI